MQWHNLAGQPRGHKKNILHSWANPHHRRYLWKCRWYKWKCPLMTRMRERERSCLAVLRWRWLIGKLEESGNLLGRRERNLYFPLGAIFRVPSIVFFSSRMPRGMGQSIDNEDNKIIISKRVTTIKWSNALAVLVVTRKRRTTVSLPVTSSQPIVVIYPHGLRLIVILAWYIFEFCLASQMSHCVRRSPSTYQIE